MPFHQASHTRDMGERADHASTDPDEPKSTPRVRTAIPVRVQRENTSVRLISPDKRSTFDAGARPVNVPQSSATSQISGEASAVSSELDTITEQSSSSISVDVPGTPTPQQRYGPILRVSSAAEHKLRGSRSVSFAENSEAHEAGNVFYPRIVRGDTPPSDDHEDDLPSDEASTLGSPVKSPQHKIKTSPLRAPPRSSSLSALSDIAALQAATVDGPVLPPVLNENVSFDYLCKRHPEVEGVVRQTNVVKAPAPRVFRVIDGIRSALSLGRAERRPTESFKIQRKEKRSSIPHPIQSPTTPPTTPSEVDRALEKLRSEIERPVSRWGRPGLMPSVDQVRVAVNTVGRELVNSESRESRKGWYKVSLHLGCFQF